MKVKALRGVCIGPDRHLKPDETADLDPGTVTFLVSIGAVERVVDPPPPPPKDEPKAAEPEKPADSAPDSTPAKPGKKEK